MRPAATPYHDPDGIRRIEGEVETVVGKEPTPRDPGRALVAVDEGMAHGQTADIGRRQRGGVGSAIRRQFRGTCQGGVERSLVADAVRPAVLGELTVVNGQDNAHLDPAPRAGLLAAHLASARSTYRPSCMISSASAI